MANEVADAIAELKAQGIQVATDPSGAHTDAYILTVPDGEQYQCSAAGLLNLKEKGELHLEGLQESHFAKKGTPNL